MAATKKRCRASPNMENMVDGAEVRHIICSIGSGNGGGVSGCVAMIFHRQLRNDAKNYFGWRLS